MKLYSDLDVKFALLTPNDGEVIGAIGASFDTPQHDVQIAQAGLTAVPHQKLNQAPCSRSPSCSFRQWTPHDHQHPRQIDPIALSTAAFSRSMAGLVPSSGPFMGPSPTPDDESAVPNELVPGAAALVPKAPPVTDM
jgi:hypothetical protein